MGCRKRSEKLLWKTDGKFRIKKQNIFGIMVKSDTHTIENQRNNNNEKNPFSKDASIRYERIIHLQNTAEIQVKYS